MLFQTPTQWAVVALVLLLGWVLGLLSRSGGARYKRDLAEERRLRAEDKATYDRELRERDTLHSAALSDRDRV